MIDMEYIERLTKVEERSKSNTHQIEDLKPVINEIHTMSKTMVELIGEVKHTNENVSDMNEKIEKIDGKVEEIENRPAKHWSNAKKTFFTSITSSIGTAVAAGILYLLNRGGI